MLTADDDGADGLKTSYLSQPGRYRAIDSALYHSLAAVVGRGDRSTRAIELAGILPGAEFFSGRLHDAKAERDAYLSRLWQMAVGRRIVFFDPDNGLDVASVPVGRAGSRRYLYRTELVQARALDAAVLVYQHLPRVQRPPYIASQLRRLGEVLPAYETLAIYASHVAFLAAVPRDQARPFRTASELAERRWMGALKVVVSPPWATERRALAS
jgi:hypothetical protein